MDRTVHDIKYRQTHKAETAAYNKRIRMSVKQEALSHYGESCVACNFSDIRALQIDHINNNGAEERRALGGQKFSGWNFYRWLKQQGWPSGYQTLCANCNAIKQAQVWENSGDHDRI